MRAEIEHFEGYSSFAWPFGLISALALAPAALDERRRVLRSSLAAAATALLVLEGELKRTPVSDLLRRRHSGNLVATIEPSGTTERTVCLMCHLDTSRSGLMFDPRFVGALGGWLALTSAAGLVQGAEAVLGASRPGRGVLGAARAVLAANLSLLAEREIRGKDVPGGNDNASGVAVVATLATELQRQPLGSTRVVALFTGCEEAGTLGAQSFLREHDTDGWLFVNFDNVGGPGTLRYLPQEGLARKWPADEGLVDWAESIASERSELGLSRAPGPIGLTYDATPVLAQGGRAITFVADDHGRIPNYHWPTDTADNVDPELVETTVEVGRELLNRLDSGRAAPAESPLGDE